MRFPKPFFRPKRNCWYVTIRKREYTLGEDRDEAFKLYHKLMVAERRPVVHSPSIAFVVESFLEWTAIRRTQKTYRCHLDFLRSFVKFAKPATEASGLKVLDVTNWLTANPQWNTTTQSNAVASVQRAYNWAVEQGILKDNPIANMVRPPRKRRTRVLTEAEQRRLIEACHEPAFLYLLSFLLETGCRPREAVNLEARHVADGLIVFPPEESKGGRDARVIVLSPVAHKLVDRMLSRNQFGPLFRNTDGKPWTYTAVRSQFRRIRLATGLPVTAYVLRHTYCTNALVNGVDAVTVGTLMGHRDPSMVGRVYGHLAQKFDYLREQARRAVG